ncbi:hypothetical protein CRM22_007595 [Opisthorchis felineus]|uniref:Isopropylmalate dehydrogenase-like domain-containing protein n=1 Tax=Opisthorchis felineus TaxID=147828 RepID=A0A4S2LF51_OPIFE|nr:hypothetical protein CRM22_007595 [Opisthorchis felineus]
MRYRIFNGLLSRIRAFPSVQMNGTACSYATTTLRKKTVTLIPGDGVWPELFLSVRNVFQEFGIPVEFEEVRLNGLSSVTSDDLNFAIESLNRTKIAMFEPGTRHSYAEASGRDIANPTAILLASCDLLRHINLNEHATKLESAIYKVVKSGQVLTADVGGRSTTSDFIEALLRQYRADARSNRDPTTSIPRLPRKS